MSFISYFNPASSQHNASEDFQNLTTGQKVTTALTTAGEVAIAIPVAIIAGPIAGAIALPFLVSSGVATFRALTDKFTTKVDPNQNNNAPVNNTNSVGVAVLINNDQEESTEDEMIVDEKQVVDDEISIEEKQMKQPLQEITLKKKPVIEQKKIHSFEELLFELGLFVQKENSISDFSRFFYVELGKMMKNQSTDEALDLIFSIINTDLIESHLNQIVIGTNYTAGGNEPKFLSEKQIKQVETCLFGLDLQEFLIAVAPIQDLNALDNFFELIENGCLFEKKVKVDVKSSILCSLHKKLMNDYMISSNTTHSFSNLLKNIKFMERVSKEGVMITGVIHVDNTLSVNYESDDDISFEEEFHETIQDKFNHKKMEREGELYHIQTLDYLKKLAAYYRLKEYKSEKLEINSFVAMLEQTSLLLDKISEDHELFKFFYQAGSEIITYYTDSSEVFDLDDLNKLKSPYNKLFKKLNHEELVIDHFIENDDQIAEFHFQNDVNERINSYMQQGLTFEEANEIVLIEMNG